MACRYLTCHGLRFSSGALLLSLAAWPAFSRLEAETTVDGANSRQFTSRAVDSRAHEEVHSRKVSALESSYAQA